MNLALHKKWSFPLRISSVNVEAADLATFAEEILTVKLHFLCSAVSWIAIEHETTLLLAFKDFVKQKGCKNKVRKYFCKRAQKLKPNHITCRGKKILGTEAVPQTVLVKTYS